ncbi:hypothetical protein [Sulfuricystis thermophila]|uniref:hypothetical protein n=1 Tax=Sulfuricystis thermophila TaxID=2496847 RepID=UPI001036C8FB|nr:hypothetical protein [Sulfuricystis thermophila]
MEYLELWLLGILRALIEVAMFFLLGQGLLALLAGKKRHDNGVYKLFVLITSPVIKLVRFIAPPQIIDRHLPFVAFFVLFWAWIGLAWLKKTYCEAHLLQCF